MHALLLLPPPLARRVFISMARLLGRRWLMPLRRRWLVLPQRRRLGRLGRLTSARARLIGLPLWVRLLGWLSFGLTMGLRLRVAWLSLTSLTRLARSQPSKLRRRHGQSRRIRPGRAQLGAAETEGARRERCWRARSRPRVRLASGRLTSGRLVGRCRCLPRAFGHMLWE